jgi:alpha-beta hydrolase superfamily lysophospholipase
LEGLRKSKNEFHYKMGKLTYELSTSDQIKLHGIHWKIDQPKAVICLVHGMGEHADRYNHFADWYNARGYAVIAYDRRGHGKSGGQKGHTPSYSAYLDEIDQLIEESKKCYPNLPYIIYGHSQGGNLVLNYTIDRKPDAACIAVTGPWIQLAFEPPKFLVMLGKFMCKIYPKFNNNSELDASHISRDKDIVQKYIDDPLVHDNISANTGIEMMQSGEKLDAFKGTMPLPTLIMHGGEDKVTSAPASISFADRVSGDVTLKIWDELYHEVHNEPEKEQVFEYTLKWIESKL